MTGNEPILEVRDLKTHFFTEAGTVRAVDGVSFEVYENEIVGLVGESGAGKSVATMSLLRLIEDPGEIVNGEILFKGKKVFGVQTEPDGDVRLDDDMLSKEEMRKQIRGNEIAPIFQDPMESLNPVYTVGSQLTEVITLNRDVTTAEAKDIALEMLFEVGIPAPEQRFDEFPHALSGGMRQRILIAMALACEPSLIIADEPTTALDVTVEGQILEMVSELQEKYDTSFIWVTHDMSVVAEICDRVNIMYLGEIIEEGPVIDVFSDTKHPYTEALLNAMPRPDETVDRLYRIPGVMPEAITPPRGCRFHTRCPDAREVCREYAPNLVEIERDHRAACLKHDVFDVGYDSSPALTEYESAQGGVTNEGETNE